MKKKSKKKIIIIISLVAILVVIIGVIVYFMNQNKKDSEEFDYSPIDTEQYYNDNSKVISKINALDSEEVKTIKEASEIMKDRGFSDYPTIPLNTMNGDLLEENEIDESSSDMYPVFQTYYESSQGDIWTIQIINGSVSAYPVSFVLDNGSEIPILIVESDTVLSYDSVTNQFYETVPYESELTMIKVDHIDTDSLDTCNLEE